MVSLHHTVVLDVGVTPVLVILHEADLVPLHLPLSKWAITGGQNVIFNDWKLSLKEFTSWRLLKDTYDPF